MVYFNFFDKKFLQFLRWDKKKLNEKIFRAFSKIIKCKCSIRGNPRLFGYHR